RQIFAHGWILNKDNAKMSKSAGDVVNPLEIKALVGVDALRYYFVRDIHLGNDAPFSQELVVGRYNTDLANNLGNLQSRTTSLLDKYFDGRTPAGSGNDQATSDLIRLAIGTAAKVKADIERMAPSYRSEERRVGK